MNSDVCFVAVFGVVLFLIESVDGFFLRRQTFFLWILLSNLWSFPCTSVCESNPLAFMLQITCRLLKALFYAKFVKIQRSLSTDRLHVQQIK